MANICEYEIHVIGTQKACNFIYEAMPALDNKYMLSDEGMDYGEFSFEGNCKWSVNFGVSDDMPSVNLSKMSLSAITNEALDYWDYSLQAKSRELKCEILCHYWSEESEFDQFDHYKNGNVVKKRKIAYAYNNEFDWETTEFVGHIGEYDESVDGEEKDAQFMSVLGSVFGTPSVLSKATDNSEIGKTSFDLYKWTFTEGIRVNGSGWSISVPDGFVVRKSNSATVVSGKKRLFEIVPEGYENEKDYKNIPIIILPGEQSEVEPVDVFHKKAIKGYAAYMCAKTFDFLSDVSVTAGAFADVWNDLAAWTTVQCTSQYSYSYQTMVSMGGFHQQLRVQTQDIKEKQKIDLDKSVQQWLNTMVCTEANITAPNKTSIEEEKCLEEAKKGKVTLFNEALKQAENDYNLATKGQQMLISTIAEHGVLGDDAEDRIREFLLDGVEVKTYYIQLFDKFIDKLIESNVSDTFLIKCYKKLHIFDEDLLEIQLDDNPIIVKQDKKVVDIRKKWKKAEDELKKPIEETKKKAEAERKAKAKEEKEKKAELERENSYNTAKTLMQKDTVKNLKQACELLEKLKEYSDSAELLAQCHVKLEAVQAQENYDKALLLINKDKEDCIEEAIKILENISQYKDALELITKSKCRLDELIMQREETEKNETYQKVTQKKYSSKKELTKAINALKELHGWKESEQKIVDYQKQLDDINKQEQDALQKELYELSVTNQYKGIYEPLINEKNQAENRIKEINGRLNSTDVKNASWLPANIVGGVCTAIAGFVFLGLGNASVGIFILVFACIFIPISVSCKKILDSVKGIKIEKQQLQRRINEIGNIIDFKEYRATNPKIQPEYAAVKDGVKYDCSVNTEKVVPEKLSQPKSPSDQSGVKKEILETLDYLDKATVSDLMNSSSMLRILSEQKITQNINELVNSGDIVKIVENQAEYFSKSKC